MNTLLSPHAHCTRMTQQMKHQTITTRMTLLLCIMMSRYTPNTNLKAAVQTHPSQTHTAIPHFVLLEKWQVKPEGLCSVRPSHVAQPGASVAQKFLLNPSSTQFSGSHKLTHCFSIVCFMPHLHVCIYCFTIIRKSKGEKKGEKHIDRQKRSRPPEMSLGFTLQAYPRALCLTKVWRINTCHNVKPKPALFLQFPTWIVQSKCDLKMLNYTWSSYCAAKCSATSTTTWKTTNNNQYFSKLITIQLKIHFTKSKLLPRDTIIGCYLLSIYWI